MKNNILNSFGYKSIEKSVLDPNKIDSQKYDIFSENQIKEFVKSVVDKNIGMALEIQKSVVSDVKNELSNLIPVNIRHNRVVKRFYISKAGKCVELCKAFEPVNKKEGYFDNNINEDEVLEFIQNHDQVDDDMLIKKFGNDITNTLNSLQEDGKLDVDDDGFYMIVESNEEQPGEGNEGEEEQPGEGEEEQPGEGEEEPGEGEENEEPGDGEEEPGEGEEQPGEGEEQPGEGEEQPGEGEEQPGEGEQFGEGEEEQPGEGEEEPINNEQPGEGNNEQPGEGEEEFNSENASDEELEAMAKKTATVSLMKFYKNSSDERLKEIAAIELKSRGINVDEGSGNGEGENGEGKNLPDDKAALDELEKWTRDYLGTYDKDDLVEYVVKLANESPAKRKELKDLYREFYSASNSGNKALKIDEEDFKNFLTENYFNHFTPGDLQSYAFLMISKNPTEYRKYKKMRDAENTPVI